MPWSERHRAMLGRMGLHTWAPSETRSPATAPAEAPASDPPAARVAAPPSAPVTPPSAAPVIPPAAVPLAPARPASPAAPARPASAATRPDATRIATLDWPALRQAVAACEACGLCRTRTQTVFGVGDEQARWLVVGEAPGAEEDRQGEPFVGAAGQLLDRMLAALGLSRNANGPGGAALPPERRVYIANTLKCRPPGNRNPTPDELARCEPFLLRQVELLQPRVVLAMGRFAVQVLLGSDEAIGRLRGRVHTWRGLPLIVTYHPAYLLRNPADKAKAWDDLLLSARAFEGAAAGGGTPRPAVPAGPADDPGP